MLLGEKIKQPGMSEQHSIIDLMNDVNNAKFEVSHKVFLLDEVQPSPFTKHTPLS